MGNALSFTNMFGTNENAENTETKEKLEDSLETKSFNNKNIKLDYLTKKDIIDYIKNMDIKNLDITEDFEEKLKSLELENFGLISMNIELYEKIKDILPVFVPDKVTKKLSKNFFVKPKFGKD